MILKIFIEHSNDIDDIYVNIEECNPHRKRKYKKLNPIVTEWFVKGRKLNTSLAFITKSCFVVPKYIRINSTHYFVMEIPNKIELQILILTF